MAGKSRLRRSLSRWANSSEQHDRDLREEYVDEGGATAIGEAPDREMVLLRGTLRSVMLRPRGGVPALEAELYDGTGAISLVWLGRRRISGVTPGVSMQVQGRIGRHDRARVIFNPRYELIP